ncbi:843_t:CDS:1, partial [Diversispora eburnea]
MNSKLFIFTILVFVILTKLSTHSAPVFQKSDTTEVRLHQLEVARFALTSNRILKTWYDYCGG